MDEWFAYLILGLLGSFMVVGEVFMIVQIIHFIHEIKYDLKLEYDKGRQRLEMELLDKQIQMARLGLIPSEAPGTPATSDPKAIGYRSNDESIKEQPCSS